MTASIIDGKARAAALRAEIAEKVRVMTATGARAPGLAVVLVGDDPASHVYVRNKGKAAEEIGFASRQITLPAGTAQDDLIAHVAALNDDSAIDGVLVQMPLPGHIDSRAVIEAIDPVKDVDGLTFASAGRLMAGADGHIPCTPQGCMILIREALGDVTGANAVVIGRSILVGKPMATLLTNANATATVAHSRTRDLQDLCRRADILVAAVGRPGMVRGDWIKPGACVIDVGINRVSAPEKGEGKTKLVGDVAFAEAQPVAGHLTPVPGGVGPMTIACLMANTLRSAQARATA